MSHRKDPRVPSSIKVSYSELNGKARDTFTTTIGGGGCFIISNTPPSEGTPLHLEFILPTHESPLRVLGKVAWRRTEYQGDRPAGAGVSFQNLSSQEKEAIRQYIDTVLSRKI